MTYLVTAANTLYLLLSLDSPSRDDLATAVSLACSSFHKLVDDSGFKEYVSELSRRCLADNVGFDIISGQGAAETGALDDFSSLLEKEKEIMRDGEVVPLLVEELVQQARALMQSVQYWDGDADSLFVKISGVRDEACITADWLTQREQVITDELKVALKSNLMRLAYALVGAAIIVLNVTIPLDFTPNETAIAGAISIALIEQALIPLLPSGMNEATYKAGLQNLSLLESDYQRLMRIGLQNLTASIGQSSDADIYSQNANTSLTDLTAGSIGTYVAGQAMLMARETSVIAYATEATPASYIILTPLSDPKGRLWVTRATGKFTIHVSDAPSSNVVITYLIIN